MRDDHNGKNVRKNFDQVAQDMKNGQIAFIKEIVRITYERLHCVEAELSRLNYERACLKRDLTDLKEGRLDRIEERHNVDDKARCVSVVAVTKMAQDKKASSPWYEPYMVKITISGACNIDFTDSDLNNSIVKTHATGSYKMADGEVRFL